MMESKVLIVEDEPITAKDISFLLEDIGIDQIEIALSYDEAIDLLESTAFDLALLDINLLSDKDGIDLAENINENYPTPFIYITAHYNSTVIERAKVTEPKAYLLKPFNKHDIQINVEMALYKLKVSQTIKCWSLKSKRVQLVLVRMRLFIWKQMTTILKYFLRTSR